MANKTNDPFPKFCTGCGLPLLRTELSPAAHKFDGQTGTSIMVATVELRCPDYPAISYHSDGMSPVTGVKHDRFIYDIKQ